MAIIVWLIQSAIAASQACCGIVRCVGRRHEETIDMVVEGGAGFASPNVLRSL
jgi:hypothetical protein